MKRGAKDYLVKPFQFDEIKMKIECALWWKRHEQTAEKQQGFDLVAHYFHSFVADSGNYPGN